MSDNDDFMLEDEEDYGFEYEDEDEEGSEPDINLENQYYNAKAQKEEDALEALNSFQAVLDLEQELAKSEWGFKALKQMIKICVLKKRYNQCLEVYEKLLSSYGRVVTRNYLEKSITNLIDFVSSPFTKQQHHHNQPQAENNNNNNTSGESLSFLESFYGKTLTFLTSQSEGPTLSPSNERLWFKTNVKLAKLELEAKNFAAFSKIIRALRASCRDDETGADDPRKGTQLLEIFALEIVYYTETRNNKKLKALYEQSLCVKSAIPHPRIMAVIRECGGKMHMRQGDWTLAVTDFFEAFKNYDEAGVAAGRISCLKYLVLAAMLSQSRINPFDSQETKAYESDRNIEAVTNLLSAYEHSDIGAFEKVLSSPLGKEAILGDPFMRDYVEELLLKLRTAVLLKLIKPYRGFMELDFISSKLNMKRDDESLENLIISLISNGQIVNGKLDQIKGLLFLSSNSEDEETSTRGSMAVINNWGRCLIKPQSSANSHVNVSGGNLLQGAAAALVDDFNK